MCYSDRLEHKGIGILISNCFGVGFDWKDVELKKAIDNREERLWEILEWMVNGGAEECDKANYFEEILSLSKGPKSQLSLIKQSFDNKKELSDLLSNEYLKQKYKNIIEKYLDGRLTQECTAHEQMLLETQEYHKKINKEGIVYLLNSKQYYKIGKTKNLPSRLSALAVGIKVPFDIQLVYSFKTKDDEKAEKVLHEKFANKRAEGEWFTLSPEDITYIQSIGDYQL